MRGYTECYIAFLDLLGFKQIVKSYECGEIAAFFDEINTISTLKITDKCNKPLISDDMIHMKVMSDSICFYVDVTITNALAALIATCNYFQVRLLQLSKPILSRGGIVKGKIYANDDVTFGPGLSDAYLLEEKVAKYPRIILTKSLIDEWTNYNSSGKGIIDYYLFRDDDAFYVLDYLFLFYGLKHEQDSWKNFAKYVMKELDLETDVSIREKYLYIDRSFKRVTEKYMKYIKEHPDA